MNANNNISRRSIAKGSAWAAPVILATATTPAYAVSITPLLTSSTKFAQSNTAGKDVTAYTCGTKVQVQIAQIAPTNYLQVSGIKSTTKLSNLKASYWLPVQAGTTFTRVSGSSTCWTVPVASGATVVRNSVTYREYVSTYTCPLTVTGTTWTQPVTSNFNFVSSCQTAPALASTTYHYTQTITATDAGGNSVNAVKDNGWTNVM